MKTECVFGLLGPTLLEVNVDWETSGYGSPNGRYNFREAIMTTITLPPDIEGPLLEEARKQGTSPELLILEKLREFLVSDKTADSSNQSGTLFDFLSSHIGAVNGSAEGLSENFGQRFAESLVEKQQQERL